MYSVAFGINNNGQVVGESSALPGGCASGFFNRRGFTIHNPFLWDPATGLHNLLGGASFGNCMSAAFAINANGNAAGYKTPNFAVCQAPGITVDPLFHAVTFAGGTVSDLGTLTPPDCRHPFAPYDNYARAINDSGVVVGTSGRQAWYSKTGALVDLGIGTATANGINNAGQIVGSTCFPSPCTSGSEPTLLPFLREAAQTDGSAYVYSTATGTLTELGTMGGYDEGNAYAINANGAVAGYVDNFDSGNSQAVTWTNGQIKGLGVLGTDTNSYAFGINVSGDVVGVSESNVSHPLPFLYHGGVMVDVNSLLPANSGWVLKDAYGINDFGQIVGDGLHNGQPRAFLLGRLAIGGIEVTQATQKFESVAKLEADLAQSGQPPVPIVANKPAVARIYLNQVSEASNFDVDVDGPGSSVSVPYTASPACTIEARREHQTIGGTVCQSIDYYFTPPAGRWTLTVTLRDPSGAGIERHILPFTSLTTNPLKIAPIGLCDAVVNGTFLCGNLATFAGLLPFLRSTYPGQVELGVAAAPRLQDLTAVGGDAWWTAMLAGIGRQWVHDGSPANLNYYAVVRGLLPDPPNAGSIGGMGYQPGHQASGRDSWFANDMSGAAVDDAAQVLAHEEGHNLGRMHAPSPATVCYGLPADLDPGWPYGNSPSIQETGFDIANHQVVQADTKADWMTYCTPRWISPYTYNGILTTQTVTATPQAARAVRRSVQATSTSQASSPFWLVAGTIVSSAVVFDPVFSFDGPIPADAVSGAYRIESRAADGTVLAIRHFDAIAAHFAAITGPAAFAEALPFDPAAASLVVLDASGTVLGQLPITGAAPTVQMVSPAGGEQRSGTQVVRWQVSGPGSANDTAWVEYSSDGGTSWETAASNVSGNQTLVDFDSLAGSNHALIRVSVSDGVNTGRIVSSPFSVSTKAPAAKITFPADGTTFEQGQMVWLQSFTLDAQDGYLDGGAVHWTSSIDGSLGTGSELPTTQLSAGHHVITLSVTNSAGLTRTNTLTITVTPRAPLNETAPADSSPPSTTASATPPANGAGWNTSDVTIALSATDPDGAADVANLTYSADGAQSVASATVAGNTARIVIFTEGVTTVHYVARDQAGNVEQAHALVVRIEKTLPTISGARAPAASAPGWNNGDVTVSFTCTAAVSPVIDCTAPTKLSGEGANQYATGTVTDAAGNQASTAVSGISIDKTPPTVTAAASPPPDAAGENSTPVTVTLTATDKEGGSGVKEVGYSSSGAQTIGPTVAAGASASVTITAIGTTTLVYAAIDQAGNKGAAKTLTIHIAGPTPPILAQTGGPLALPGGGPAALLAVLLILLVIGLGLSLRRRQRASVARRSI